MTTDFSFAQFFSFCKKNWFTLGLLVLGLYVYFRKDLSFQIQVQTPDKLEQNIARQPKEKMTENGTANHQVDRLELPFVGNNWKGKNAIAELAKINEGEKQAFMERFAKVALTEQQKFGIPASVILGTSLYLSYAGHREIAVAANNFFALPCSADWKGNCVETQGQNYRRYQTAWASFRDFSNFAKENFSHLKGKDYQSWATALQSTGLGGEDGFKENLEAIIESYKLFQLDNN